VTKHIGYDIQCKIIRSKNRQKKNWVYSLKTEKEKINYNKVSLPTYINEEGQKQKSQQHKLQQNKKIRCINWRRFYMG